jgi:hypothetical protein
MTVSGTNTYDQNRNQIINMAMSYIGVRTQGRVLTANEINESSDILNAMVKSWKNRGDYLWKTAEGTLFTANGQASYILDGSTANATESYTETTLASAAVSGATSITVSSGTGFVVGYYIGVKQDDNTIHWTTVASVSGVTIGLTAALTADAAEDNAVYTYQTKINRPELINSARSRQDTNDIPLTMLSRDTYFNIPVKSIENRPNQFFYNKQLTFGQMYFWPVPNNVDITIKFTFQKMFFDFDTPTNTPDFPVEWIRALALNLAVDLARVYGKDRDFREQLKRDADEALYDCQGFDRENTSVRFQPATSVNISTYM